MRLRSLLIASCGTVLIACATTRGTTNVVTPLGARLAPGALTGVPEPLRRDPNAKVILSSAAHLPAAAFLPSQAARGEKVYEESCGTCHAPVEHFGQTFVDNWKDRRVYDFYALVRATMPLDKPGSLTDQQYLDVVAYMLKANHHVPPRADSLKADTASLRATKIAVKLP
jgi:mono/diheme cytochrome c family protein